jgi:uncharacterized protein YdcH (DUF465 family)
MIKHNVQELKSAAKERLISMGMDDIHIKEIRVDLKSNVLKNQVLLSDNTICDFVFTHTGIVWFFFDPKSTFKNLPQEELYALYSYYAFDESKSFIDFVVRSEIPEIEKLTLEESHTFRLFDKNNNIVNITIKSREKTNAERLVDKLKQKYR